MSASAAAFATRPGPIKLKPVRQATHWSDRVAQAALLLVVLALLAFLAAPLLAILLQALEGNQGEFVGLTYYWVFEDRCWIISNMQVVENMHTFLP